MIFLNCNAKPIKIDANFVKNPADHFIDIATIGHPKKLRCKYMNFYDSNTSRCLVFKAIETSENLLDL